MSALDAVKLFAQLIIRHPALYIINIKMLTQKTAGRNDFKVPLQPAVLKNKNHSINDNYARHVRKHDPLREHAHDRGTALQDRS